MCQNRKRVFLFLVPFKPACKGSPQKTEGPTHRHTDTHRHGDGQWLFCRKAVIKIMKAYHVALTSDLQAVTEAPASCVVYGCVCVCDSANPIESFASWTCGMDARGVLRIATYGCGSKKPVPKMEPW